jgi:hypothetical protein
MLSSHSRRFNHSAIEHTIRRYCLDSRSPIGVEDRFRGNDQSLALPLSFLRRQESRMQSGNGAEKSRVSYSSSVYNILIYCNNEY